MFSCPSSDRFLFSSGLAGQVKNKNNMLSYELGKIDTGLVRASVQDVLLVPSRCVLRAHHILSHCPIIGSGKNNRQKSPEDLQKFDPNHS